MKKLLLLLCAVLTVCLILCSCMNTSAGRVSEKTKETTAARQPDATAYSGDNQGLFDDNRETMLPTEMTGMMETVMDAVATEWDEMVENGEVEDGDGNVGERENEDGDGNIDPDAVD